MRLTLPLQSDLFTGPAPEHQMSLELREIDAVVSSHAEWAKAVHADLTSSRGVSSRKGRRGLSGAVVLRLGILRAYLQVSIRRLSQLISDSVSLRQFLGLSLLDPAPKRSAIQGNLKKVRPETWGLVLEGLLRSSEALEHESGDRVRIDCTVTESNVHHPTDSSLLWDCLRTLNRLLKKAQRSGITCDRSWIREAKKARKKINFAQRQAKRIPHYRALLSQLSSALEESTRVVAALRTLPSEGDRTRLAELIETFVMRSRQVADQTRRRVFEGESVPVAEKVFSIFEVHTDLIRKRKQSEYGHKLVLTVGKSGLVLDCVIERGNPADVTLVERQLQRQAALYGKPPRDAVFDGAFASGENLRRAKRLGVKRCAFSKGKGLTPKEMAGSRRTYGRLKNFRAGVEGIISDLKRTYGLGRCLWKGWSGFKAYVWSSVLTFNLVKLARLRLAPT